MIVTGFGPKIKKKQLKVPARQYAVWLQDQVGNLFAKEAVAAGKLKPNTKAYNDFKAAHGFDSRRGHLTGNTQSVLDNSNLMIISIRGKIGKWRVILNMNRLLFYRTVGDLVDGRSYIEFYEEKKVPNERITAFKVGWTRNARRFFKHLEG